MAFNEGIRQAALDAGLNDLQIAELKAAFFFYDVHDSGDIPCTDLMKIFRTQLHWSCPTPQELATMAVELGLGGSSRRLNICDVLLVILAWTRHANCRALAQLPIYVHRISWISGKGASSKGKGEARARTRARGRAGAGLAARLLLTRARARARTRALLPSLLTQLARLQLSATRQ